MDRSDQRNLARARGTHRLWVFVALVCAVVPFAAGIPNTVHAQATVYHVSPAGSDSSPGTESRPFRTIQRAADIVNPGDTVIVEDGIYTGTGVGTSCGSSTRPIVCLTRGGASGRPVTFRARNPLRAKLDGQANRSTDGFRLISNANYVRIEGFEIYGVGNATGSSSGIEVYSAGHDVVITQNDIHDIGRLCTDVTNGQVAIFVQQPNVTITRNRIHDIGRFAPGESGCQPATTYYQRLDHGVYVNGRYLSSTIPGANDVLITNNVFYNHGRGWSIQVYPGTVTGLSILNNTFAFPNPYQAGHIIIGAHTVNGTIQNNIFYKPLKAAINYYTGTQTNLQVTDNLVHNAAVFTTTPPGATVAANLSADPMLVGTVTRPYDFHLRSGSPATDSGLFLATVAVDCDGLDRVGPHDIGACEFGALPSEAPPVLSPDSGTFAGAVTVTLSASAGATIRYTTDGSMPGPLSPVYTDPLTLTKTTTVRAQASSASKSDSAVAEATLLIQSDVVAPTVSITSPMNGSLVSRSVTISAVAQDDVGVTSVRFTVDGVTIATDTTAPYSATWNARKAPRGSHVITAVATDASGNAATATITVKTH